MSVIYRVKKGGYNLHIEFTLSLVSTLREKQLEGSAIGGVMGKLYFFMPIFEFLIFYGS